MSEVPKPNDIAEQKRKAKSDQINQYINKYPRFKGLPERFLEIVTDVVVSIDEIDSKEGLFQKADEIDNLGHMHFFENYFSKFGYRTENRIEKKSFKELRHALMLGQTRILLNQELDSQQGNQTERQRRQDFFNGLELCSNLENLGHPEITPPINDKFL